MSNTLLYVTFKNHPEFGRMKVVRGETVCKQCALLEIYSLCQNIEFGSECETVPRTCVGDNYHYEPAPK